MSFYVYIMASGRNGTVYVGQTDDLVRRAWQHRTFAIPGFTSRYRCTRLVWFAEFPDRDSALSREGQMKAWKRRWKLELIESANPQWHDLYDTLVSFVPARHQDALDASLRWQHGM